MRLRCGVVGTRVVLIVFRPNVFRNGGSECLLGNADPMKEAPEAQLIAYHASGSPDTQGVAHGP